MLRSDRGAVTAVVGCLAVALIGGAYVVGEGVGRSEIAQEQRRSWVSQRGEAVTGNPDWQTREKYGVPQPPPFPVVFDGKSIPQAECAKSEDCRTEQRDYSDLQAQWRAAGAAEGQLALALWAVFIAGFGTLIGGLGTIFLISTVREARRGNELTRQSLITDHRAWLELDVEFTSDWKFVGDSYELAFLIKARNIGKTPAMGVHLRAHFFRRDSDVGSVADEVAEYARLLKDRPPKFFSVNIFPTRSHGQECEITMAAARLLNANKEDGVFAVSVGIFGQYRTIFDGPQDEPRQTCMVFDIFRRDEHGRPTLAFTREDIFVRANELALMQPIGPSGHIT